MIGLAAVAHMGMAAVSGWSQVATGSLLTAVWQGVVLTVVAGLALRLVPRTPAAVRFAIWFSVFVLVMVLPALSLWPRAANAAVARGPWLTIDARWCVAIAAVWLVASLVRAGTLVGAALRVRALWKRATPMELASPSGVQPTLRDETAKDGPPMIAGMTRRGARICTSDEVDRPTVIGFFAPKILIPAWLLEKLTGAELEQIVLHEAGHLGRADDWMNLLQKIALVVFPLNPVLAWVERRLCFERELAVDERVLQAFAGRAGAAKAYAACLATLAEHRLGQRALALSLGALGRESELGRRVGRILRRPEGMKPLHTKLVLGGAMLGLVVAATGFERCPQVVGFTDGAAQNLAQRGSGLTPTHGDETAMNGAPGGVVETNRGSARAFDVVYKTPVRSQIQRVSQVTHETQAMAQYASVQQAEQADASDKAQRTDGAVRMVQITAPISVGPRRQPTLRDDAAKDGPPTFVEAQWVVTTWQDGSSTRMVMTTATGPTDVGTAGPSSTGTPDQAAGSGAASQVGYSFAVPVRGGWIVFRL